MFVPTDTPNTYVLTTKPLLPMKTYLRITTSDKMNTVIADVFTAESIRAVNLEYILEYDMNLNMSDDTAIYKGDDLTLMIIELTPERLDKDLTELDVTGITLPIDESTVIHQLKHYSKDYTVFDKQFIRKNDFPGATAKTIIKAEHYNDNKEINLKEDYSVRYYKGTEDSLPHVLLTKAVHDNLYDGLYELGA